MISNCYLKTKDHELALDYIVQVWQLAEEKFGVRSIQCAFALVETANIHSDKNDVTAAIDSQNRALKIFQEQDNHKTVKLEYMSEVFLKLAGYYKRAENMTE